MELDPIGSRWSRKRLLFWRSSPILHEVIRIFMLLPPTWSKVCHESLVGIIIEMSCKIFYQKQRIAERQWNTPLISVISTIHLMEVGWEWTRRVPTLTIVDRVKSSMSILTIILILHVPSPSLFLPRSSGSMSLLSLSIPRSSLTLTNLPCLVYHPCNTKK